MCPQVSWQAYSEKRWYKSKVKWQINDKPQEGLCLHRQRNTKFHIKSVSDIHDTSRSHGAFSGPTSFPGPATQLNSSRLKGQQNFNAQLRHRIHRNLKEKEAKQGGKKRRKKQEGGRKRRDKKETKKKLIKTRRRKEIRESKTIKRNSQTKNACFNQKRLLATHVKCIDLTPNR